MPTIELVQTILYVEDQERSAAFYTAILGREPDLHVPGMTEFHFSGSCRLGLMPNRGIAKILDGKTPHPDKGNGIPRCELYLKVDDAPTAYHHAVAHGARPISAVQPRDWGDRAGYLADPDGHIIAFAQTIA